MRLPVPELLFQHPDHQSHGVFPRSDLDCNNDQAGAVLDVGELEGSQHAPDA